MRTVCRPWPSMTMPTCWSVLARMAQFCCGSEQLSEEDSLVLQCYSSAVANTMFLCVINV